MIGRYRNSFAEINLQALEQNFHSLKTLAGEAGLAPMVKADAYGHGDIQVSRLCERLGARYLGVTLIEEGIRLRTAGVQMPILFMGFFDSVGAEAIVKYRLTPALSSFDQIEKLKSVLHETAGFPVHLKFNTGMQRLGFEPESATEVGRLFANNHYLQVTGLCSHLVSSEDVSQAQGRSQEQIKLFKEIHKNLKGILPNAFATHISNTGGLLSGLQSGFDIYRPGLSLYGVLPKLEKKFEQKSSPLFLPVLTLKSYVTLVHNVKKGSTVSYGGTWRAKQDSRVAVIPLGYADGIPRIVSNKGRVLIHGEYCPMAGTICMDYFMVDVTHLKNEIVIGDEVIVIGHQGENSISATEIAEHAGTIAYEILTGIQQRVPRVYLH